MFGTPSKVAIAIRFQVIGNVTVVIMRYMIAPIIPERLHRHTLRRIRWQIAQGQAATIASLQLGDQLGRFGPMKACLIDHQNNAAFSTSRAPKAFFGQLTKGLSRAAQRANADDLPRAPIGGGILFPFRGMHPGRANFALLSAGHPHARQRWKQTQFGFVFDIHISTTGRMSQKPGNRAFF
jgi:hypothetical protein